MTQPHVWNVAVLEIMIAHAEKGVRLLMHDIERAPDITQQSAFERDHYTAQRAKIGPLLQAIDDYKRMLVQAYQVPEMVV